MVVATGETCSLFTKHFLSCLWVWKKIHSSHQTEVTLLCLGPDFPSYQTFMWPVRTIIIPILQRNEERHRGFNNLAEVIQIRKLYIQKSDSLAFALNDCPVPTVGISVGERSKRFGWRLVMVAWNWCQKTLSKQRRAAQTITTGSQHDGVWRRTAWGWWSWDVSIKGLVVLLKKASPMRVKAWESEEVKEALVCRRCRDFSFLT